MSHSTHNRSLWGWFLQARWLNQQCQSTEGNQLVVKSGLNATRTTPPCYNNTTIGNCLYLQCKGPNVTNQICWTCKNCSHKCAADCEHCVTQCNTELFWQYSLLTSRQENEPYIRSTWLTESAFTQMLIQLAILYQNLRSAIPRRFRMKSASFIFRSGLMFLLCKSVLSMIVANASKNTVSGRWNCLTNSALHWQ